MMQTTNPYRDKMVRDSRATINAFLKESPEFIYGQPGFSISSVDGTVSEWDLASAPVLSKECQFLPKLETEHFVDEFIKFSAVETSKPYSAENVSVFAYWRARVLRVRGWIETLSYELNFELLEQTHDKFITEIGEGVVVSLRTKSPKLSLT